MSLISLSFFIFLAAVFVVYYAVPKRFQWMVLLAASMFFYSHCGLKSALCILTTATTIYIATLWMQKLLVRQKNYIKANKATLSKEEKSAYKASVKIKRKCILQVTLLINFGLLCFFKYFHFMLEQVNAILGIFGGTEISDTFRFIVPLGISFYTFQSVAYLLDVYWEKIEPERNYFKHLLFISFFPQITQGPISEYNQLSNELFTEHSLDYKNYSWGLQRMVWGFFKKMVIANQLSHYVTLVFHNYESYSGISVLIGAFMYSIQIYADFSGYMDIMCGFCEMLGIKLTENFLRPYFSKSVTEYWRRWHISLGWWFKNYIYYPCGMSEWSRKLGKMLKPKFGKHFADTFPATIALVIVWSATGLWHGASWAYIIWGLLNGVFIILSLWMEPVNKAFVSKLKINEDTWCWRAFLTIRTFILITFIKVLPEVGSLSDGLGLWKQIFTNHTIPTSLNTLLPFMKITWIIDRINVLLLTMGIIIWFIFSLIERKKQVRFYFDQLPKIVRCFFLSILLICILSYGYRSSINIGNFLYAQF